MLSAVKEDTERMKKRLGSYDLQRVGQSFTSIRKLVNQLEILVNALEACVAPEAPGSMSLGGRWKNPSPPTAP